MEQDFYVGRLRDEHGLDVLVPGADDRKIVHDVIYEELCRGVVKDGSRDEYRRIMRRARRATARRASCSAAPRSTCWSAPEDSPVPVFDTTRLHAERAVTLALAP